MYLPILLFMHGIVNVSTYLNLKRNTGYYTVILREGNVIG